jgi:hypothetical protein
VPSATTEAAPRQAGSRGFALAQLHPIRAPDFVFNLVVRGMTCATMKDLQRRTVLLGGIGRVVYAMSNRRLFEFTGDDSAHTSFALPCREILRNGSRPITVIGPLLEDEAAQSHEGYWR